MPYRNYSQYEYMKAVVYSIQPSHRVPRACPIDCVTICIIYGMIYKRVIHALSWYTMKYSTCHLHFLGILILA